MRSTDSFEYDYIVVNGDQRSKVKDGVETPISEHEWYRMNRAHDSAACGECRFVPDLATILPWHVPQILREKANDKPRSVGKFTSHGWKGHSVFYLFKCKECQELGVDYPHGYTANGLLYLRCDNCRFKILLYDREYYENEGMAVPSGFFGSIRIMIKLRWQLRKKRKKFAGEVARIESKGVKVLVNSETDLKP